MDFAVGLQLFPSLSFFGDALFKHSQTISPLLNLLLAMSKQQFSVICSE